jgi:CheY-like chemotaxis protein
LKPDHYQSPGFCLQVFDIIETGVVMSDVPGLPRLLLIEDHEILARLTAQLLRDAGIDVRIAKSGKEGIGVAAAFLPEIVLCDMCLPDMSGTEVAGELRVTPNIRDLFFAIHTGSDALLGPGIDAAEISMILSKPLTEQKIARLLAEFSEWRRRNTSPESMDPKPKV